VNKLETIRKILIAKPNIAWTEEKAQLSYPRSSGYYNFHGIRIAPKGPLLDAQALQEFSQSLLQELIPIGPSSISHCYLFPARSPAIRLGTLYFLDIGEEDSDVENRLALSIYPCETMAKDVGYRGIIEIGGYECPDPCRKARKCSFKTSKYAFFARILQP
jgi:hypothetical protein